MMKRYLTAGKLVLGAILVFLSFPTISQDDESDPHNGLWKYQRCSTLYLNPVAAHKKIEAYSTVLFDITASGRPVNIRIKESGAEGLLDSAAMRAIKYWRYYAYIDQGVESERKDVSVTFTFGGENEAQAEDCTHTPWVAITHAGDPKDPFEHLKLCPIPVMPLLAAKQSLSGRVSVTYDVSAEGKVENVRLQNTDENDLFHQPAARALRRWEYIPFLQSDVAIRRENIETVFYFGDHPDGDKAGGCNFSSWNDAHQLVKTSAFKEQP